MQGGSSGFGRSLLLETYPLAKGLVSERDNIIEAWLRHSFWGKSSVLTRVHNSYEPGLSGTHCEKYH